MIRQFKYMLALVGLIALVSCFMNGMDAQQHKDFIRENYINPTLKP